MTDCERLPEERAVRVAVQVDAVDPQRVEHSGEVVGGQRRAVEVGRGAELLATQPDVLDVVALQRLEPRTVDDRRRARAASIDEQHVATGEQWCEQIEVVVARIGRRVAGPALDGDDGAERRLVVVGGAMELEADGDGGTVWIERVERPLDRATPCARNVRAAAQQPGPLDCRLRLVGGLGGNGRCGRADGDRHHEGDTGEHVRDRNAQALPDRTTSARTVDAMTRPFLAQSIRRSRWAAIGAAVAVTVGAGGVLTTSAASSEAGSLFVPITPCRLIDTEAARQLSDCWSGPLGAGETYLGPGERCARRMRHPGLGGCRGDEHHRRQPDVVQLPHRVPGRREPPHDEQHQLDRRSSRDGERGDLGAVGRRCGGPLQRVGHDRSPDRRRWLLRPDRFRPAGHDRAGRRGWRDRRNWTAGTDRTERRSRRRRVRTARTARMARTAQMARMAQTARMRLQRRLATARRRSRRWRGTEAARRSNCRPAPVDRVASRSTGGTCGPRTRTPTT